MGLLPAYRGMGLGTKLMAGILKMSRGKFDGLVLAVLGKNRRAKKLYEKMGFKVCGALKKSAKMVYGIDDQVLMQRALPR